MVFGSQEPYSDDIFSDTRMSFGEHIEDLRAHMLRAIYGFLIALFFSFFIGSYVLELIARPVEIALQDYWDRYYKNRAQEALRRDAEGDPALEPFRQPLEVEMSTVENGKEVRKTYKIHDPLKLFARSKMYEPIIGKKPTLTTLRVEEGFMVLFKVCIVTAFVLASPWVFYQIWAFIAAGLYPQERRYVNVFLPFSLLLFLGGVVVCEIFVMPRAVSALLWFNEWLGFEPELRLNEWLGFAIMMPLVFGLGFQTPLVMLFLERTGLMTIDSMRKHRRMAWFIMAIVAAIIVPSPDAFSMLLLWVPMSMLYELGIVLCRMQPPRTTIDEDSDSDALVEV